MPMATIIDTTVVNLAPELSVPEPDAKGRWHYTYVTWHPDTGEWYGGKHTTSNLNDGYRGSGTVLRVHPAFKEFAFQIIGFYPTSKSAFAAEIELLADAVHVDPLCLNRVDGGLGNSSEDARRIMSAPGFQEARRAGYAAKMADPEYQEKHRALMQAFWKNNHEQRAKQKAGIAAHWANPEAVARRNAQIQERWADPENRARYLASNHAHTKSEAFREKRRAEMKKRWENPEWRNKEKWLAKLAASKRGGLSSKTSDTRQTALDL